MKTQELGRIDSATVATRRQATLERRTRLAHEFRQQLRAELPQAGPVELALIDCATSCHIEISEGTARFLQGRASEKALVRLQFCRSTLARVLKQLGLSKPAEPPQGDAQDETMEDIVRRFGGTPKPQEAVNGTPQPR
jgi:hypothetical protein